MADIFNRRVLQSIYNKGPHFNYNISIPVAQPKWSNLNLSALFYSTGGKHCRMDLMF